MLFDLTLYEITFLKYYEVKYYSFSEIKLITNSLKNHIQKFLQKYNFAIVTIIFRGFRGQVS